MLDYQIKAHMFFQYKPSQPVDLYFSSRCSTRTIKYIRRKRSFVLPCRCTVLSIDSKYSQTRVRSSCIHGVIMGLMCSQMSSQVAMHIESAMTSFNSTNKWLFSCVRICVCSQWGRTWKSLTTIRAEILVDRFMVCGWWCCCWWRRWVYMMCHIWHGTTMIVWRTNHALWFIVRVLKLSTCWWWWWQCWSCCTNSVVICSVSQFRLHHHRGWRFLWDM